MIMPNEHILVEHAPGRWKRLGELTEAEHAAMQALTLRANEMRLELTGMLVRWQAARPGSAEMISSEVYQACSDAELSLQRAVDAMRAHMSELGLA
jgi:hypothetical protein